MYLRDVVLVTWSSPRAVICDTVQLGGRERTLPREFNTRYSTKVVCPVLMANARRTAKPRFTGERDCLSPHRWETVRFGRPIREMPARKRNAPEDAGIPGNQVDSPASEHTSERTAFPRIAAIRVIAPGAYALQ